MRDVEGEQKCGFSQRPHFLDLVGAGGLAEEEARELAYRLVKRAEEAAAPSPEDVRARRETSRPRQS